MNTRYLTISAVAFVTALAAQTATAETIKTKTYVDTADTIEERKIDFSAFDVNEDGLYSKSEVGERLFYVFDLDGNEVVDNIEWNDKSMYTITPMEKETYKFVDYDDDGYTDLSTYTFETFYKESGLIRFDNDKDGLSAAEFIGVSFQELDDNDNNTIELDEWAEAYTDMIRPETSEPERYN